MKNIKAAIFDLDGTLIDSMGVWCKIDIDFLKKRNKAVPNNLKKEIDHLTFEECANYFKNTFNLKESPESIMKEWNDMAYSEYSNNIKLKNGVKTFLNLLKSKNIKIGLATSNTLSLVEIVLKNNGIYDLLDSITTISEVKRGKNFPDIYLLAANKLNTSPKECIVFEDILPAIEGAKSAGMKVVGVYDYYSKDYTKNIKAKSDYYINKYDDLEDLAI